MCDFCYPYFDEKFPGLKVIAKLELKRIGIDLFYEGSYLRDYYSKEEYSRLINQYPCPHCGMKGYAEMYWFEIPKNLLKFKNDIREIGELAVKTPFMILKHPFAEKIAELMKNILNKTRAIPLTEGYFRARKTKFKPYSYEDSGPPPNHIAPDGRFNHAGDGVLYVATSAELAYREMMRKPNESFYMVQLKINIPVKIFDLTELYAYDSEVFQALVASPLLFSSRGGRGRNAPGYIFTRFISDCAKYYGFDAIRYASSYSSTHHNLVFFKKIPHEIVDYFTIVSTSIWPATQKNGGFLRLWGAINVWWNEHKKTVRITTKVNQRILSKSQKPKRQTRSVRK